MYQKAFIFGPYLPWRVDIHTVTVTADLSVPNVGHFGHGHFGPDFSATDVSATENAKGGRFGHNHKLGVGVCACINI